MSPGAAVSSPENAVEREADALAERAMAVTPNRNETSWTSGSSRGPRGDRSLAPEVRSYFEPRFGWDFGRVRVHADGEAAAAAHAVQARAYASGADIVFGEGEYAPATSRGRQLLAHELAHVVQHETAGRATPAALATAHDAAGPLLRQPVEKQSSPRGNIRGEKRQKSADPKAPKKLRLLVVLWDPGRTDQGPRPTVQQIDDSLFGPQATSLREYYLNQSGGKAVIDKVAVLGWYKADKPAAHYWNHPERAGDGFKDGHIEKWTEALRKADKSVDFLSFDEDGNGELSGEELGILIIIPEKTPGGYYRKTEEENGRPLVLDGIKIGWIAEVYMPSPMNPGVTRHEVGHPFFDLPDLYKKYSGDGVAGAYSIMDESYTDAQIDAPSRIKLGWVLERSITVSGSYGITSVETSREALTYDRAGSRPREFFVIERRERGTYDRDLKVHGLVIWRVLGQVGRGTLYRFKPHGKEAWPMSQKLDKFPLEWSDGKASGVLVSVDPKRPDEVQIEISGQKPPRPR